MSDFTASRADAAALRAWGKHDAHRAALAVLWQVYPEDEAQRELAATLAWHAERARMAVDFSCRALAASMLDDELGPLERQRDDALREMTDAAEALLRREPPEPRAAASAAADIARAAQLPPSLVATAYRIARARLRRP